MKTNVHIKDEPVDCQVEKFIRLYSYSTATTKANSNQDLEASTCAWCQKLGGRTFSTRTDSGETKNLCSEICFNHYRRASFKKNKGSEFDVEQNLSSIVKLKSPEKKKREQQISENNRRKILIPHRHPAPSNSKITRVTSPNLTSKRYRSSSPPSTTNQVSINSTNLPVSLTWQPSLFPWSCPIDINRFQYPLLPPPPPPSLPPPVPIPSTVSTRSSSDLFTSLSKGIISNVTCILPTFLPLPIPIPIPIPSGYSKATSHQQTQTDSPKRLRRTST